MIIRRTIDGAMLALFAIAMAIAVFLCGCSQQRDTEASQTRSLKRTEVRVEQVLAPDGKLVQLTSKTTTLEAEDSGRIEREDVLVQPPQVLMDLGSAAKTAVAAVADRVAPGSGVAVDYLWQAVAGATGLGAAAAGAKVVADGRKRRRYIKAMDDYSSDLEDAETDDDVARVKEKHRQRQQALGIHGDLERERLGA